MSGFNTLARTQILAQSATPVASANLTSKQTLATVAIPPMGPNDSLYVELMWSFTNNANAKTPSVEFGNAVISGGWDLASNAFWKHWNRVHNRGATNSQAFAPAGLSAGGGVSSAGPATSAVETSGGVNLTFNVTKAVGTDSATLESYAVILFRG
jgi:PKD repeat protein